MKDESRIDAKKIISFLGHGTLVYENNVIDGMLRVDTDSRIQISFTRCTFFDDVEIGYTNSGYITFIECSFKKSVRIKGCKLERLSIRQSEVSHINIDDGNIKDLELSITNWGDLKIRGGEYGQLIIGEINNKCFLNKLMINLDKIKGIINIGNASIASFCLQGNIAFETKLIVRNIKVFQLHLRFLDCKDSNLRLSEIKADLLHDFKREEIFLPENLIDKSKKRIQQFYKKSLFDISYSSVGKAVIDALDLTSFDKVIMYDSIVSEANWSNIIWPINIDSFSIHEKDKFYARYNKGFTEDRNEIMRRRENYRQLKFAMNKQNDFIGEQYFHGLEMKTYDKVLLWKKDFWTKLILKLSFWSSNYGQSFIRPILSLSLINGFLFWLLYLTHQSKFHSYDFANGSYYVDTVAEFLRLVNPLHKNEPELTNYAFIIDTLMRIFASYFIYNLIRATRRFVR